VADGQSIRTPLPKRWRLRRIRFELSFLVSCNRNLCEQGSSLNVLGFQIAFRPAYGMHYMRKTLLTVFPAGDTIDFIDAI